MSLKVRFCTTYAYDDIKVIIDAIISVWKECCERVNKRVDGVARDESVQEKVT